MLALNNTAEGFTLPIYFGNPVQNDNTASFIIDTTFTDILVATKDCGFRCAYPVYDINASTTAIRRLNQTVNTQSKVVGEFTGEMVIDQVCIVYDTVCAKDVEFYAMAENWEFFNILGLAPINALEGPNLIRMLY